MRRFIEESLLMGLCLVVLVPSSELSRAPVPLLLALILVSLALESPLKDWMHGWFLLAVPLWLWQRDLSFFAPLLAYAFWQRRPWLAVVPLLFVLVPLSLPGLVGLCLALWLARMEEQSRKEEALRMTLRDEFTQKERLSRAISREADKAFEKNMEIAVLKERNRIAREIHDSVGHTLSAALLQLKALWMTAPEAMRPRIEVLTEQMSKGMEDIRKSLHNLHSQSQPWAVSVEALTEPMRPHYEIICTIEVDDDAPWPIKQTLLAMLREALTNVRKHSDGQTVRVVVRELPRHYTAFVKDNGSKKPEASGLGLSGMEELARQMGGTLTRGWQDGFFVQMTLPKAPPLKQGEPNNESNHYR